VSNINPRGFSGYLGWSFDPKTCNGNLQVLNDGQTVKYVANTSGHSSVLGDAPLDSGLHVWKVTITGGSSHWIGARILFFFSLFSAQLTQLPEIQA